jgi:mannose-6-phosphate isomerase-like protein (cupin superfamily)
MKTEAFKSAFLLTTISVGLVLCTGCRTAKEKAMETVYESNTYLDSEALPPHAELPAGQEALLLTWNTTAGQSQHLLQLASGATLKTRSHRNHDLTLTCVAGSGIIEIEGTRYRLEASRSVVIPRFHSYKIIVDNNSLPFRAILVYSPPFTGEDVEITED